MWLLLSVLGFIPLITGQLTRSNGSELSCDFEDEFNELNKTICSYKFFGYWSNFISREQSSVNRDSFWFDGPNKGVTDRGHYLRFYGHGSNLKIDKAVILSGNYCLSLDYYATKETRGTTLQITAVDANQDVDDERTLFEVEGANIDRWRHIEWTVSFEDNNYRIAIRMDGALGIDNLSFRDGSCAEEFHENLYCLKAENCWWLSNVDNSQLSINREFPKNSGPRCLAFSYQSIADDSSLSIIERGVDDGIENVLVNSNVPHDRKTIVSVTIDPVVRLSITIRYTSLYLDNLKLSLGKCPPPGFCLFNEDFCNWSPEGTAYIGLGRMISPWRMSLVQKGNTENRKETDYVNVFRANRNQRIFARNQEIGNNGNYSEPYFYSDQYLGRSHNFKIATLISEFISPGSYCLRMITSYFRLSRIEVVKIEDNSHTVILRTGFFQGNESGIWRETLVDIKNAHSEFKVKVETESRVEPAPFEMREISLEPGTCADFNTTITMPCDGRQLPCDNFVSTV